MFESPVAACFSSHADHQHANNIGMPRMPAGWRSPELRHLCFSIPATLVELIFSILQPVVPKIAPRFDSLKK